jgi:hypothetical protein
MPLATEETTKGTMCTSPLLAGWKEFEQCASLKERFDAIENTLEK